MRWVVFVLLAASSVPVSAQSAAVPLDIEATYAKIQENLFVYAVPGSNHVGNVIMTMVDGDASLSVVAEELQRKFSLSPTAAHAVLRAWVASASVTDAADPVSRANAAAALWIRASEVAKNDAVTLEAVEYLADADGVDRRFESMASLLRSARDGRSVAIAALNSTYDQEATRVLWEAAVAGKSEDPLLLLAAALKYSNDAVALAAFERRRPLGSLTVEQEAALAERAIAALTTRGLSSEAIAIFESTAPEVRTAILTNAGSYGGSVDFHRGVIELDMQRQGVGLLLAAAYAIDGHPDQVKAILPAIRTARARLQEHDRSAFDDPVDRLVATEAGLAKEDPFEIAAGFIAATEEHEARTTDGVLLRLFGRFARAEGYGEVAAFMTNRARAGHREGVVPGELMPYVRRFAVPASSPESPALASASNIEPRLVLFRERSIDESMPRIAADCTTVERLRQEGVVFPEGVEPLRAERRGSDIVAVMVSQRVDPVGEVSGGGYWVVRSSDAGATWQFLYTGLREYQPYVLVRDSSLPLFDDSRLTLEAEVRELDESSITFPPVSLRTKREARNLFVEFSWEALTRDSDDDGLTDLLEERLLLDANDPDTDADGVRDGEDPLPQVAFRDTGSVVSEVLEAIFSPSTPRVGAALITGLDEAANACGPPRLSHWTPGARFVIGDPSSFASLRPPVQVIVLAPSEMAAARAKFGLFFASSVSPIVVDRTGTKAVVAVNESWVANVYRVEKMNGTWRVMVIGGWIS